jgi:hypothetical protein
VDAVKPLPPARPKLAFPFLAAAGLAGCLVFVFLCAWTLVAGFRLGSQLLRGNDELAAANSPPAVIDPTVANPLPTATHPPSTEAAAVLPPAISTSPPQVEYHLQIVKRGQDGLILLNVGQVKLPLEPVMNFSLEVVDSRHEKNWIPK